MVWLILATARLTELGLVLGLLLGCLDLLDAGTHLADVHALYTDLGVSLGRLRK